MDVRKREENETFMREGEIEQDKEKYTLGWSILGGRKWMELNERERERDVGGGKR